MGTIRYNLKAFPCLMLETLGWWGRETLEGDHIEDGLFYKRQFSFAGIYVDVSPLIGDHERQAMREHLEDRGYSMMEHDILRSEHLVPTIVLHEGISAGDLSSIREDGLLSVTFDLVWIADIGHWGLRPKQKIGSGFYGPRVEVRTYSKYVYVNFFEKYGDKGTVWLSDRVQAELDVIRAERNQIPDWGSAMLSGFSLFMHSTLGGDNPVFHHWKSFTDKHTPIPKALDVFDGYYHVDEDNSEAAVYFRTSRSHQHILGWAKSQKTGPFTKQAQAYVRRSVTSDTPHSKPHSRAIDIPDHRVVPVASLCFDTLSHDGTAPEDDQVGKLMVLGLSKSLTPIRFDSEMTTGELYSALADKSAQLAYRAYLPDDALNSALSLKSRVYVHLDHDGFRFLFALRCSVFCGYGRTRKLPALIALPYFVASKGLKAGYQTRWRGTQPEVHAAIHAVPGLALALTQALNEAKAKISKLEQGLDLITEPTLGIPLPSGMVLTNPGFGRQEVERIDRSRCKTDDAYQSFVQRYGYGSGRNTKRIDSLCGWYEVGRAILPIRRLADWARDMFSQRGKNLLVPAGGTSSICNGLQRARSVDLEALEANTLEDIYPETAHETRRYMTRTIDWD